MSQTVMIVDDSRPLHALVKVHLGEEDFIFHSAYDGSSALDLAASIEPDLILLDVDMPDMNGYDVCRFLKFDQATASIPIIFLTAAASDDEKACGLELRAADYIAKPFNPNELLTRVRVALRTRRLLDLLAPSDSQTPVPEPNGDISANARLSLSQLLAARSENPWNRKPPASVGDEA